MVLLNSLQDGVEKAPFNRRERKVDAKPARLKPFGRARKVNTMFFNSLRSWRKATLHAGSSLNLPSRQIFNAQPPLWLKDCYFFNSPILSL
jgi:hypothetical protein